MVSGLLFVLAPRIVPTNAPMLRATSEPTAEPALLGRWAGQGPMTLDGFSAPGGSYEIAWRLSGAQAQAADRAWQFSLNLLDYDFPHSQLGLGRKDVLGAVDFVQLPGQQPPFADTVTLASIPAGRYYIEVDTCQVCVWQVSMWQRDVSRIGPTGAASFGKLRMSGRE